MHGGPISGSSGSGDGVSLLPLPPRVLGVATVAFTVVSLTAYRVYSSLAGHPMNTSVLQLVGWDRLTDVFESSRP
jgi:hypothetical protein